MDRLKLLFRPLRCMLLGMLGGGLLLHLTNPAQGTEGVWLGGLLGFLYCGIATLYRCWTCAKRASGMCQCHQTDSWFGRLCDNHPLCAITLALLYTGFLFVTVRLLFVAFGVCACEVWDHIARPLLHLFR